MKLASIQKIHSIQPHPNSEVSRIEIGKVKEWPVVVPKGQFKNGDLVIFVEIDSIVPEANPHFEFLRKQKFRVWNARFKGAPSSGLVLSTSILPEGFIDFKEEDDLTTILGIVKYERPIDLSISGDAKGGFPTNLISISDELNLLSYASALSELEGKEIYITQKVDGSSSSFIFNNHEFSACSRRLELKEGSGFPWLAVNKYDIKNKLVSIGSDVAIQAECIGPKLNGNTMELKELEIRVFRIKDLRTKTLFSLEEMKKFCGLLELPMVELVCEPFIFNKEIHTVEFFRDIADSQKWSTNSQPGEGIVISPTIPFYSPILQKSWSLKIINQNYK